MAAAVPSPRRAYWLKTLHQWHWISSALSLVGLLLFTVTGFTLNHAAQIEARPQVDRKTAQLTPALLALVKPAPGRDAGRDAGDKPAEAALPPALADWVEATLAIEVAGRAAEWSPEEIYLALPRPGGDAWLRIDRAEGALDYERTDRG